MEQSLQIQLNSSTEYNLRPENHLINQSIHLQEFKKVDILFYDSVCRLKRHYTLSGIYQLVQTILLVGFLMIDGKLLNQKINLDVAFILGIIATGLQTVQRLFFRWLAFRNIKDLLQFCQQIGHSTQQALVQQIKSFEQCVSKTMYNQRKRILISHRNLTPQIKKIFQNVISDLILNHLKFLHPCLSICECYLKFYAYSAVFGAILFISTTYQKTQAEVVVLVIFVILQSLSIIEIIILALMVYLFPLLAIIFCCRKCLKKQRHIKLPNPQQVTQQVISQAGEDCSICYQIFIIGSKVIKLNCSPKHIFHPQCIKIWTKSHFQCPICRISIE